MTLRQEIVTIRSLRSLFAGCFGDPGHPDHCLLIGGAEEPLYLPDNFGGLGEPAKIFFTRDYPASALHEIAHWCIASRPRRRHIDYGYWYVPDGRNPQQQSAFENMECAPQALEWIFSTAVRLPFYESCDNLDGGSGSASGQFRQRIFQQGCKYWRDGLPPRASIFLDRIMESYASHREVTDFWTVDQAYQAESFSELL